MTCANETHAKIRKAGEAAGFLRTANSASKDFALRKFAALLEERRDCLLDCNSKDLREARQSGLEESALSRLKLDPSKISELSRMVRSVSMLEDPIGKEFDFMEMDCGLVRHLIRVPLGVVGVVFEARPDALCQIASLAIKAGNSAVLKGGKEARFSSAAFAGVFREALFSSGLPEDSLILLEGREELQAMLSCRKEIALIIVRGSYETVRSISSATKIHVMGHDAGKCTIYVDRSADLGKAVSVCLDAKTSYPAACNSVEKILVHKDIIFAFLSEALPKFESAGVEVRGDKETMGVAKSLGIMISEASEDDFSTEFLSKIIAIRTVGSLGDAISEINSLGSHHTDAIIAEDKEAWRVFSGNVDSACVFLNASTRFSDGYRLGLGAEVGISNGKIHARGPVGLEGLTTVKWIVEGDGHKVSDYCGPQARDFTHRKLV